MPEKLSTKAKLKMMGVTLVPVPLNPVLNLFDMQNTKEVATVICGIMNTAVTKKGLTGYLSVLPDLWPAYQDIGMVDNELLDMNEEEFIELKEHIKTKLDFEGTNDAIEELAEEIAMHVIGIVVATIKYAQIKKATG